MAIYERLSIVNKLPRSYHLEVHVMRAWIDNGTLTITSVCSENVYARNKFGMEFYASLTSPDSPYRGLWSAVRALNRS